MAGWRGWMLGALAAAAATAGTAALIHSRDVAHARSVAAALLAARNPDPPRFDPAMVADMPELARRYFAQAIAPGTPLQTLVALEMTGTFVMNGRPLAMAANQTLAPPQRGFVWAATIGAGLMRFSGSDGYHAPEGGPPDSWTRFWLHGLVPLARIGPNPDHTRSAAARAMLEAIWSPASLLPASGARWTQVGADRVEIRFDTAPDFGAMTLLFDAAGRPVEVTAQRWSDANPERRFRLQPVGGRILSHVTFGGFTVPGQVEFGNLWGTPDYAPFFLATVTAARF